jgi:DNA-binding NarL/FixJ family response regulator
MSPQILVVEDHPLYGQVLRDVIKAALPSSQVDHATTLAEAMAALPVGYDLVILDLWLPDTQGYSGLSTLRKLSPKQPILVTSAFADSTVMHRVAELGACSFVPKSASRATLIAAISAALSGEQCFHCSSPCGEAASSGGLRERLESLTRRQRHVLDLLRQGMLNKQIAYELGVGETTVKAHVGSVMHKLNLSSRTKVALEASQLELAPVMELYAPPSVRTNGRATPAH